MAEQENEQNVGILLEIYYFMKNKWILSSVFPNRKYAPSLEVSYADFRAILTYQQPMNNNLHRWRCKERACAGAHYIQVKKNAHFLVEIFLSLRNCFMLLMILDEIQKLSGKLASKNSICNTTFMSLASRRILALQGTPRLSIKFMLMALSDAISLISHQCKPFFPVFFIFFN